MRTFLPYESFLASAQVLDRQRLGKQRVETLQILRAIELPGYGWQNHPAVRMWREHASGHAMLTGVIGFGASAGVPADASAGELAALRALQNTPSRRPSRALRALSEFVESVQPGDDIGVLVSHGQSLLVCQVIGPYTFEPRGAAGLSHRRAVRWDRVIPRSAMPRLSALQDVRPLFSVAWNPELAQ